MLQDLPTTMSHQRLRSDHLQKDYIPVHGPLWGNLHIEKVWFSYNVSSDFFYTLFTYFRSWIPPPDAQFSRSGFCILCTLAPWKVTKALWAANMDSNSTNAYPALILERCMSTMMYLVIHYSPCAFISDDFYNHIFTQRCPKLSDKVFIHPCFKVTYPIVYIYAALLVACIYVLIHNIEW